MEVSRSKVRHSTEETSDAGASTREKFGESGRTTVSEVGDDRKFLAADLFPVVDGILEGHQRPLVLAPVKFLPSLLHLRRQIRRKSSCQTSVRQMFGESEEVGERTTEKEGVGGETPRQT